MWLFTHLEVFWLGWQGIDKHVNGHFFTFSLFLAGKFNLPTTLDPRKEYYWIKLKF
jgi:hypothetical protein